MKPFALSSFLLLILACTPKAPPGVKELTPEQASPLFTAGARPVDANTPDYRKENGIIAGAALLTSSSAYKLDELPTDKASKLVFYCANRL